MEYTVKEVRKADLKIGDKWINFKIWEGKYGNYQPEHREAEIEFPIRFFRNNITVSQIMDLSKQTFEPASDDSRNYREYVQLGLENLPLDISNGCIESCEPFN